MHKNDNLGEVAKRKILLQSRVGSYVHNLVDIHSDEDIMTYVMPSKSDLIKGKSYSKNTVGKNDSNVLDIRELGNGLMKSNVNTLDILFSDKISVSEPEILEIIHKREEIASARLPYLFNSTFGMYNSKKAKLSQGVQKTKHLVEKHGYDTKGAMLCYRFVDFLSRYHNNGFSSYEKAISYNKRESEIVLSIKNGDYTRKQIDDLFKAKEIEIVTIKQDFLQAEVNIKVLEEAQELISNMIFRKLYEAYRES